MSDPTRPVASGRNAQGAWTAVSAASPSQDRTRAQVVVPPKVVIPVVFVPGIMGSNLKALREIGLQIAPSKRVLAAAGAKVWRLDDITEFGMTWMSRGPAERQLLLNHENLAVDDLGKVDDFPEAKGRISSLKNFYEQQRRLRTTRGWGTVAWAFYGQFLEKLDTDLKGLAIQGKVANPELQRLVDLLLQPLEGATKTPGPLNTDGIHKLAGFEFPVYGCGYNWAASNRQSGEKLAEKIDAIIAGHHGKRGQVCKQVIVITHSMGGLVARAASKLHGAESKILGVVHGVMPTHGAAAMYKRAALGFGRETKGWGLEWLKGIASAYALGNTAAETTPVMAYNPGPLELAPNHRYNNGRPWLFINDGNGKVIKSLPEQGDPYAEIYGRTDVWWRAIHPEYLDPARIHTNPLQKFRRRLGDVKGFHLAVADTGFHSNTYSHYGADLKHSAWGEISWNTAASRIHSLPTGNHGSGVRRVLEPSTKVAGSADQWTIKVHQGAAGPLLLDQLGQDVKAAVSEQRDAGDGTVPAIASAAAVDPHSKVVVRHSEKGYAHDASYADQRVHHAVLDAIVRMIQPIAAS